MSSQQSREHSTTRGFRITTRPMVPPRMSSLYHLVVRGRSIDHPYHSTDSEDERFSTPQTRRRRPSAGFSAIFETSNYTLAVLNTSSAEPSRSPAADQQFTPTRPRVAPYMTTPRTVSPQRTATPVASVQLSWEEAQDLYPPPTTAERWRALEAAMRRPERAASVKRGRRTARMVTFQPTWVVNQLRRNRSRSNLIGVQNRRLLRRDEPDVFRDGAAVDSFVADLWEQVAARHR